MPGKILKTRIQNKYDSLQNLQNINPYVLQGEIVSAYQTIGVIGDGGEVENRQIIQLYVGPGHFNDLVPIVGPASDVKKWAKVDNFVDVVVENFLADDTSLGAIAENDTVNTLINKINNNFDKIEEEINDFVSIDSTSDLTNDGEGADVPIKDFITGYQSYQFVSRDSVLNYITGLSIDDVPTIKNEVQTLIDAIQDQIDQIEGSLDDYVTDNELNGILANYLQQVQIGDKNGGVILKPNSNTISSSALWNQIVDETQDDIESIADAEASTALEQAKQYTDT